MGFLDPTDFRWILPTETDANSPLSEQLMSSIRNNLEANTLNRIATSYKAQVISGEGTDTLTIEKVSDDDDDWPVNIAAGLIAVFRSGAQLGQQYFITANTGLLDSPDTATLTTSTTFASNITAGDELIIVYTQTGLAHTHDGVDSSPVGIDTTLGNRNVNVSSSTTPVTNSETLEVLLNNNIKSIYLIVEAEINTGQNWSDEGTSYKAWASFVAGSPFSWIDSDGTLHNNTQVNVNIPATTYTEIADFSNTTGDIFYTRVEKLDITPLGLTHKDLRRYQVTVNASVATTGSRSTTSRFTIIGSSSLV